jgi:hypothetical protein
MSAEASSSRDAPTLPSPEPPSISPTLPSTSSSQTHPSPPLHSPETTRQIAEARAALEASMTNIGNQHFSSLQSRAQNLHANTAQLDKQQKDVIKATDGLKKETEKLRKWADEGQRMVKELGNVQNWAEMLERDFLVLGETIRLANGGGSQSQSGSGSEWETDSEFEEEGGEKEGQGDEERKVVDQEPGVREEMRVVDAEGDTEMHDTEDNDKGKGKAVDVEQETTNTEHQPEDLGGSSTATGSDPSSSSVHTAASATS